MANFNPNDEFPTFTEVVMWPESQDLMSLKGFRENSALINSEKGLEIYGSSAYRVEPNWLEKAKNGEIETDYDEDADFDGEVEDIYVDYGFPFDDED